MGVFVQHSSINNAAKRLPPQTTTPPPPMHASFDYQGLIKIYLAQATSLNR